MFKHAMLFFCVFVLVACATKQREPVVVIENVLCYLGNDPQIKKEVENLRKGKERSTSTTKGFCFIVKKKELPPDVVARICGADFSQCWES